MYDTKLHLMVRLPFWRSGECGVRIAITHRMTLPVRLTSMGQIDLLKIIQIR